MNPLPEDHAHLIMHDASRFADHAHLAIYGGVILSVASTVASVPWLAGVVVEPVLDDEGHPLPRFRMGHKDDNKMYTITVEVDDV